MEFSWSAAGAQRYEAIKQFAVERLPYSAQRVAAHDFDRAGWDAAAQFGLAGLSVPKEWGGLGLGVLSAAYAIEALGYGCEDAGLVFSLSAHLLACVMPVAHFGSDRLKQEVLNELARGKRIGANAATEPDAGSDFTSLRTRFRTDGDDYILSGEKQFVTNAPVADELLVYAISEPGKGFFAIDAFLVPRTCPGLRVGPPLEKSGLTTSPMAAVFLDECRVPSWRRLGKVGQGGVIFMQSMVGERACLFAAWIGVMERQIARAIAQAQKRSQFGRPIGKNQAISHEIVNAKLRLEASRLLLYRACWSIDEGQRPTLDVCLAKVSVSEALVQTALFGVQLHGGSGFMVETGAERVLRDALASKIYSGTNELMRDLAAKELGL